MKPLAGISLMIALIVSVPASCFAQETVWMELSDRVVRLHQQGQYSEAIELAEEALEVAERTFGPEHP